MKKKSAIKKWELALLISICAALFSGMWAQSEQKELSEKLIRLHVVAVSDEPRQQELKLEVRDMAIELLEPALEDARDRVQAQEIIRAILPDLETAAVNMAVAKGQRLDAVASLESENYPTRHYEGFSLPAGEYLSLKLVLGEGKGKNWWCVVFPPLCLEAAEGVADTATGLSEGDIALISEDTGAYELKFKLLELWGSLKSHF